MAGSAEDPETDATAKGGSLDRRLRELRRELDQTKVQRGDRGQRPGGKSPALTLAIRAASELVAAVLVGAAIGWGMDWWLDTSPIFLLIFFLLGFAAGVLNVFRAMKRIEADLANADDETKT